MTAPRHGSLCRDCNHRAPSAGMLFTYRPEYGAVLCNKCYAAHKAEKEVGDGSGR